MFEYVTLEVDWAQLQDVLNAHGEHGWRVVAIDRKQTRWDAYRVVVERRHVTFDRTPMRCGRCTLCVPSDDNERVDAGIRGQTVDQYRGTVRCHR